MFMNMGTFEFFCSSYQHFFIASYLFSGALVPFAVYFTRRNPLFGEKRILFADVHYFFINIFFIHMLVDIYASFRVYFKNI